MAPTYKILWRSVIGVILSYYNKIFHGNECHVTGVEFTTKNEGNIDDNARKTIWVVLRELYSIVLTLQILIRIEVGSPPWMRQEKSGIFFRFFEK
jgi:hypothetical protein